MALGGCCPSAEASVPLRRALMLRPLLEKLEEYQCLRVSIGSSASLRGLFSVASIGLKVMTCFSATGRFSDLVRLASPTFAYSGNMWQQAASTADAAAATATITTKSNTTTTTTATTASTSTSTSAGASTPAPQHHHESHQHERWTATISISHHHPISPESKSKTKPALPSSRWPYLQ